jgi:hypothetical protein
VSEESIPRAILIPEAVSEELIPQTILIPEAEKN